MFTVTALLASLAVGASAKVYMQETFDGDWQDRWTVGAPKEEGQMGEWKTATALGDEDNSRIQTGEDYRFYSLTAPLDAEVSNEGQDLVVSYTVRFDQKIDCGGAYLKLVPPGFDASKFGGDTDYSIMFGPDVCGTSTRKTHMILTYKGKNLLTKKNIRADTDQDPHRYTLVLKADNSYQVLKDGEEIESGSLYDDFDFLPPKRIKDPEASKPEDWVDEAKIPDPEAVKPEGWDDVPEFIPDPEAEKPEDWDEEEDGEWEPPQISNPEYKGEWSAPMIDNPDYKGAWVHPEIDNPDYFEDDKVQAVCAPCSHVGFELWQVKAGTMFDDIAVADSLADIQEFEDAALERNKAEAAERKRVEDEKRQKEEEERKKREEEEKKAKEAEEAEEEEDEDEDDAEEADANADEL